MQRAKLHGRKLVLTLSLPALDPQTARIELTVAIRHAGHVLLNANESAPAGARHDTVTVELKRAVPRHSSATATVLTAVAGTTPSTVTTQRTIQL